MVETPPSGPSYGQGTSGFPGAPGQFPGVPSGPPSWASSAPRGASRLLTFASLGISVIATALAIVGWFRPMQEPAASHSTNPTYTEQQISDAKARSCSALDIVNKGVTQHAGTNVPEHSSGDPAMAEAQAADSRLAIITGGWYLRDRLDPATPPAITAAIQHLSGVLLDLGANYLAGAKNADPDQSALVSEGNSAFDRALELCK